MAIANPVNSQIRFKRQSAKGTLAGATGAQILRRESATFTLKKDTYDTESEINSTQQLGSVRHGVRQVDGKVNGFFSPGTYSDFMSSIVRRDFAAVTAVTGASVTIAGAGPTYTVTRAAGSYLTDGFKIGMVIRLSAGTLNAANINRNLLITNVTALVATVMPVNGVNGVAMVAEGPVTGTTITAVGKVTYAPTTGHTNVYYTAETWDPDVPSSERNIDVKASQINLSLPGSGNAKIDITFVGLDQTSSASAYFTSPTAETTTGVLVAASGLLLLAGSPVATVTDLSINIDGKESPAEGVVGSNIRPDIFRGIVKVSGSFSAYFDSRTLADTFVDETAQSLIGVFTSDSTNNADFASFYLPSLVVTSSDGDDGAAKGKKRSYSFTCQYNAAGGAALASPQTTIQIQDSAAT